MKKNSIAIVILFLIVIYGCNSSESKKAIYYTGTVLTKSIPKGWICETNESSILVKYKHNVDKLNTISLSRGPKKKLLDDFGWKGDCFIKLKFVKRLSAVQYSALVQKRQNLLSKLEEDKTINGKTKFGMENNIIDKNPIPMYFNDEFSVFLELSETSFIKIFPQKIQRERDSILKQIEKLFLKYKKKSQQKNTPVKNSRPENAEAKNTLSATVTLKGILCDDVSSPHYLMAHPLVCIEKGDYPGGSEMILIKQSNPRQLVHTVFPKKSAVPKNKKKAVVLRGYFQGIQNQEPYKHRKPSDDYKYFVVSSWEYQK